MTKPNATLDVIDSLMIGCLSALLGFAALDKVWHASAFMTAINSYRILPFPMGKWLAPVIIAAELTIAVALLVPVLRRTASLHAALLMSIFTVGLITNRIDGRDAICGCWFSISMAQGDMHFVLNAFVIAMALWIWRTAGERLTFWDKAWQVGRSALRQSEGTRQQV